MKILHVIRGLANSSGTTHIVGPLAEAQAALGCAVSVYCVDKPPAPAILPAPERVDGFCAALSVPLGNPGISLELARRLRRTVPDFDIVHVHAIWNFPSWWAMRAARRAAVPYVVAPQGSLAPWALGQNRFGKMLYGRLTEVPLLRRADCLQALTETELRQCRAFGLDTRAAIIPNGVDPCWLDGNHRPDPGYFDLPADARSLLFLSRIHLKKGLELLVDTMEILRKELPLLHVVVAGSDAGSGYLAQIQQRCRERGVADRFRFLGELDGPRKRAAFAAAHAFVLPSHSEGLPVAALEALASGVPVVLSEACNLPQVAESRAGFVVPPDTAGIAAALRTLYSMPQTARRDMGMRGRQLVASGFTWPRIAARTLACYRELIAARAAP